MTVEELIEELKACDPDAIVTMSHYEKTLDKYEQIEVGDVITMQDRVQII